MGQESVLNRGLKRKFRSGTWTTGGKHEDRRCIKHDLVLSTGQFTSTSYGFTERFRRYQRLTLATQGIYQSFHLQVNKATKFKWFVQRTIKASATSQKRLRGGSSEPLLLLEWYQSLESSLKIVLDCWGGLWSKTYLLCWSLCQAVNTFFDIPFDNYDGSDNHHLH